MKPKIGDTVQFKKSGIIGTVEKILRGVCVVNTPTSRLTAWPEDLIICGLSEVSLEKEMEEHQRICNEIMAIQGIEPIEAETEEVWHCSKGYIFKDENGNVINATKIVLEKKKKEYPKTYEECAKVLLERASVRNDLGYKGELLVALQKLLVCRDAYWKIAGEEMGLGKPWEPDWTKADERKYCIVNTEGNITKWVQKTTNKILAFPTAEMRDAFKENFDPDIEICKELL